MRLSLCASKACHALRGPSYCSSIPPVTRHTPSPCAIRHLLATRKMSSRSTRGRPQNTSNPVQFHVIEDAEYMGAYCQGGYHPVNIGDSFNNRYRIVHKLGYGTYSTIWMARDERHGQLVALKVCIASANDREREVLSVLGGDPDAFNKEATVVSGKHLIPKLLDTFQVSGPHGTHTCLVTDIVRTTLRDASSGPCGNQMQLPVARAMAAQVVLAVAYLHQQGFVHGDLHTGNIFIQLPNKLSLRSDEELYKEFDKPIHVKVRTSDNRPLPKGVPRTAILPFGFPTPTSELNLREARILIGDFGEAWCPHKEQRFYCNTPLSYRPPEDHFEPAQPRSFPSDVWTLATSIWGIIAIGPLFESMLPTVDSITARQVELLGKLPPEWWARWEPRSKYCDEEGTVWERQRIYRDWDDAFESRVQEHRRDDGMDVMSVEEKIAFLTVLKHMLAYKPEERWTMSDVLKSEWITNWAMPEYEKLVK